MRMARGSWPSGPGQGFWRRELGCCAEPSRAAPNILKMKVSGFSRYSLCVSIGIVMLAGCGGASQTNGTLALVPQSKAIPLAAVRGGSWMLPEASSEALLYATTGGGDVYVISYATGKLVGTITGVDEAQGVCSDSNGNVFVTAYETENVIEYAHGGTTPIAKLPDFGYYPNGCAIDPTTGNLAVANFQAMDGSGGTVAIYTGAQGKPTYYTAPGMGSYDWCAYDNQGDLFVDGSGAYGLAEMPEGSQTFNDISLSVAGQGLQWDGQYLAMVNPSSKVVYRIAASGSSGSVTGTVHFKGLIGTLGDDFAFNGSKIVMPFGARSGELTKIGVWKYPHGGQVGRVLKGGGSGYYALTLSN